ncbi:transcriptional attenuator, LytR family [Geodermatophilus pulveris]|uniref:Transcriptional attenuator, LytR family n=1 Tax=Geodermatophilus pulveris TaxID=1564159 RepID=A0A239FYA0_9ACTN|nr:LCP family protein [Geodermatophilus pulveris]SNS61242.1 transcriptional attenuator, LytR family [Geodermatophilus pulveris]
MSEHDWDATRPIGPRRSRPLPPPGGAPRPAPASDAPARGRGLPAVLGLTVLNAVLPGTAFLAAGRRRLGAGVLAVTLLLLGVAAWLATAGQRTAARIAVDPTALIGVFVTIVVLGLLWAVVVVAGHRALLTPRTPRAGRALGAVLVAALVAAVAYPVVTVGQVALAQRALIGGLFADRESATVDAATPFGEQERVNVLLLGGDGGVGRDGVRTDTVIVASVDTGTGDTTLFSLPRNLQDLPFPADSPLAEVYPDGFDAGSETESLLNAVYRNGPAEHPDVLGPTDDPGADFLKLGVGEALGLDIDYFVLVNLDGFSRLVDALGGITVNVNYWVPINGNPGTGELPDDYIEPGPAQRMDGVRALDFARGRFGLTDYDRMARQRCTIDAIIDAADPVTLLERYEELAATTQDIVSTDIPRSALDDFVDVAFLVKDAEVRSVVFDDTVIDPAYPDYDRIRAIVAEAIDPAPTADDAAAGTPTPAPSPDPSAAPPPGGDPATVTDVADACAYDPVRAAEARAAGEPPNQAD